MTTPSAPPRPTSNATLALLALAKLCVHLYANRGYGYFRDELYYIACSERLDWGYVDHPSLSILVLRIARAILGDSLPALRFTPALAGAATVFLTGLIVREVGGGRFAQALACVAAIVAPLYLGINDYYSMNSFDLLLWALAAYLLARIVKSGSPRLWILLGVVLGLGLANKISVLWLGTGIFAGLVLTPKRRALLTPWPWAAGALAGAMFLPYVAWNAAHGWPTLEFVRNATRYKMVETTPLDLLKALFLDMHPFNAPIWIAGLLFLLVSKRGKEFRILGWIWLVVFAILAASRTSRAAYLGPAYPILLAAGGVAIEAFASRRGLGWLKPATIAILLVGGALTAPLAIPILPVETYVAYTKALGQAPRSDERKEMGELPQHFADMFGWEEMAEKVAVAWHRLPEADRSGAIIFARNYGEAGAIDFFGRRDFGLPGAVSPHNNYWFWAPLDRQPSVVIIIGGNREDHLESLESVEPAGTIECRWCMPYERDLTVWIGRGLKVPVREIWSHERNFS